MKTIKKWNPIEPYDIVGTEHWLESMAKSGLFPVKFGEFFVRFEKSSPNPERRYRLDANPNSYINPKPEMLELYEQAGWHFGLRAKKFFVYYSDDPDAVEPYTDSQSRALSLDALEADCKHSATWGCAVVCIILISTFNRFISGRTLLPPLLVISLPLVYIIDLFQTYRTLRDVRRMRSWLEEGRPLENFQLSSSRQAYLFIRNTVVIVILLIVVLLQCLTSWLS